MRGREQLPLQETAEGDPVGLDGRSPLGCCGSWAPSGRMGEGTTAGRLGESPASGFPGGLSDTVLRPVLARSPPPPPRPVLSEQEAEGTVGAWQRGRQRGQADRKQVRCVQKTGTEARSQDGAGDAGGIGVGRRRAAGCG